MKILYHPCQVWRFITGFSGVRRHFHKDNLNFIVVKQTFLNIITFCPLALPEREVGIKQFMVD